MPDHDYRDKNDSENEGDTESENANVMSATGNVNERLAGFRNVFGRDMIRIL